MAPGPDSSSRAIRPAWRFRAMSPAEVNVDPIQGEFFSVETIPDLGAAFVREAIQNALDALAGAGPVRVRIGLCAAGEEVDGSTRDALLRGLPPHLRARDNGLRAVPRGDEPMNYLVVEDFGTRGLIGDPEQYEDRDGGGSTRNDFFYFWRNVGRTGKESQDRGRWGLGKTVFQAASRINAFFGLTVRRGEEDAPLLMGQATLRTHRREGTRYAPYGYYARFRDELPLPISDPRSLREFCDAFRLTRDRQPGLSVVVPYPDQDIRLDGLVRSVVHHYFFPIVTGALKVTLRQGEEEWSLDADSVRGVVEAMPGRDRDALLGLLDLTDWARRLPESCYVRLEPPPQRRAPRWNDQVLPEEAVSRLREPFERGERIALVVPVLVKPKGRSAVLSEFRVLLERDESLDRPQDFFVREGITIAGVSSLRSGPVRAIVTVYEKALSSLLGDAENPAHTEWQERSSHFKDRYQHGPFTLRFVKNSPREIAAALSRPPQGRDTSLLRHLFYAAPRTLGVPRVSLDRKPEGERQPEAPAPPTAVEAPESALSWRIAPREAGFTVSIEISNGAPPQIAFEVEAAYDVRRGDPFLRWSPLDFSLGLPPLEIVPHEAEVIETAGNRLVLRAIGPASRVSLVGFDPNRDLRVRVRQLEGSA